MGKDSGAERRAQKAERRADNIRRHARSNDSGAERRAQKAERRADNIRDHADRQQSRNSSSDDDALPTILGGCFAIVLIIAGIGWVLEKVNEWWNGLF
jgi:F0F1-type ATP synthase assembly protein I